MKVESMSTCSDKMGGLLVERKCMEEYPGIVTIERAL